MQKTISFIGGGNMARALIGGLISAGWSAANIRVSDPLPAQRELIQKSWPGVRVLEDNQQVLVGAAVLVFAVKPQSLAACARALSPQMKTARPLVMSIAAGVRVRALQDWLGADLPIVRCMPNTPALIGCGATGLYASEQVDAAAKVIAEQILGAVGKVIWLTKEADLDVVTALSGSGPAYFFLVMEAMAAAASKLGLQPDAARLLSLQTALGSARLALESNEPLLALRARVTSKGGTTEQAVGVLERGGLRGLFADALLAATQRAGSLCDEAERSARG